MKIYTKKGDKGNTSLFGGRKVSKSIVRLEVIGCLDELNSIIGMAIAELSEKQKKTQEKAPENEVSAKLERIQGEILQVGSDIATPYSASTSFQKNIARIDHEPIARLEKEIDEMEANLPKLRYFILPGGSKASSIIQLARAVTRRAERNTVRLGKGAKVNPQVLTYLNRLSDWLFIYARYLNQAQKEPERIWRA